MLVSLDIYGAFIFWACICAIGIVLLGLWAPETKGVPMERMDELFAPRWYMLWRSKIEVADDSDGERTTSSSLSIMSENVLKEKNGFQKTGE